MTKQEKVIVSAYTGVLMCDSDDVHEYIQKKFGRPVFTHELADKDIQKKIKEKSYEDFLEICNREEPEPHEDCPEAHIPNRDSADWIPHRSIFGGLGEKVYTCNQCGYNIGFRRENFCPSCGADMRGIKEHE